MKQKSKFIINTIIMIIILLSFSTTLATNYTPNANNSIKYLSKNNTNLTHFIEDNTQFITLSSTEIDQNNKNIENTQNIENIENTENEDTSLNLYAQSCILIECSTGRTAYEKASEIQKYPASITKILTAILAVENCDMNDIVTITNEMTSKVPAGYTTAYLMPGEQLTVEQLLNALLIPSANDAGFALAIHISGSVEEFANLMNERAAQLGCTNTHFTNPSGIHDDNHYTTAKDMAIIAMHALKYTQITDIGCKTSYILEPSNSYSRTFETTNTLIKPTENNYYEYATGLKTGYTEPAGSCLIATAKKDNMEFLAIILDAPSPENGIVYRDIDCKTLFDYGFENYDIITKIEEEEEPQLPIFQDPLRSKNSLSTYLKIGMFIIIILLLFTISKMKQPKKNK